MGCTHSKIENEEAVSRCKERRDFMKKAVSSRNEFAASHTAYAMALKNTGGALADYGQGELQHQQTLDTCHHPQHQHPPLESLPPPPPPLPNFSPLKRATTMPQFVLPKTHTAPIQEHNQHSIQEEDEDDDENDHEGDGRRNGDGGRESARPPPSPPPNNSFPPPPPESKDITWDYFFPMAAPSPSETEEIRSSDNDQSDGSGFNSSNYRRSHNVVNVNRNVYGIVGDKNSSSNMEPHRLEKVVETEAVETPVKKPKQMAHSNMAPQESRGGKPASHVSFIQILSDLDDHFLKASESAQEVSRMLEATRLHYHSNFADNRGHIDHSARVMRVITWNRSFRGIPNAGDGKDDFDADEHETHATVLDKLLAWEKKLYDEVKAGELMKLEYQKKVALLNKQKKHGANIESLEKTKAAVSHLHTRYIVDMQSMDSTVSEVNRLRDDQLYPKLVTLVNGMAQMWDSMLVHHSNQLKIVVDLRCVDVSQAPKETSEEHHGCTVQLWEVFQEWHSQFLKLVSHQKEYIQALNSWLKLNLIPLESNLKEKVSSPLRVQNPPIQTILDAWHEHLSNLPTELAGNAIFSFAGVIKTIIQQQEEEVKLKEKCQEASKDHARKNRSFEDWYNKYMQHRTTDEMEPDRDDANLAERKFVVEAAKKRLGEEIEAHRKHCKLVREKSFTSLKTHLPELFRAMSEFSFASSEMYKRLQSLSHQHPSK